MKTGPNITHGGFFELAHLVVLLFVVFFKILISQSKVTLTGRFLFRTLKTIKSILHINQLNGMSDYLSFPEQRSISELSLPPPRRQSSRLMERFFWLPPHFLGLSLLQLVFLLIKDIVAVLFESVFEIQGGP